MKRIPIILGLMVLASMAWGQLMFQPGHVASLGAESFTPASVAGLVTWLDAGSGVTLNGTNVSVWVDRSANGYNLNQTVAANQPELRTNVLNGKPVVHFAAKGRYVGITNTLAALTNKTVFFVSRQVAYKSSVDNWHIIFDATGAFKNDEHGFSASAGGGPSWRTYVAGAVQTRCTASYNFFEIYSYRMNGAETPKNNYFTNYVAFANDSLVSTVGATGHFVAGSLSSFSAGADNTDLAELIVYDNPITMANHSNVVAYLKTKYGL